MHAQVARDTITSRVQLDEVIVFSTKETTPREQLPVALSALPASLLECEGTSSLKQLAARVPNFYMPDYGSKLNSPVYIRGIGTRTGAPAVGLYVDGVPYLEAASFDFHLLDVERVEILRGPQGTLYGRNTMAGIIDVTTRSPLRHQGTTARLQAGNYRRLEASVSHDARPWTRAGFSVAVNHLRDGGYATNLHDGTPSGKREETAARARLLLEHGARSRSDVHARFEHDRQRGYPYGKIDNGKTGPVNHDEPASYTRRLLSTGYAFSRRAEGHDLRAVTGYQYLDDRQAVDQDFSPAPVYFATQKQVQHMLSQEIILRSRLQGDYRHVSGLFAFAQRVDKTIDVFIRSNGMHDSRHDDQRAGGLALYHQSTLDNLLLPGLTLSVGARLDREIARQRYTTAAASRVAWLHSFEILPKATLRYQRARQSAYFSVARGHKTGGFNVSFNTPDEQTFDPEYSWNYETGIRLAAPRVSAAVTLFYIDWRNQQITRVIALNAGGNGSQIRNAGRSSSKGVELSVTATPARHLDLTLDYGYTDARFKEYLYDPYAPGTSGRYDGNRVPLVPRQTLSAAAAYRLLFPAGWLDDLTLNARYNGTGKTFWQETNASARPYFATLHAGLSAAKGPFELAFRLDNIFNKRPDVYQFAVGSDSYAQRGRPFTATVELKINL